MIPAFGSAWSRAGEEGLIEAICYRKIRVTGALRAHTTGADAIGDSSS